MKTDVRTIELCMHDLPYGGHRPDRITHRPDGCSRLPITVSWGRNPNACQTLNGVRTVLPRRPNGSTWTLDSSQTLNSVWTICHYVRTNANLNYLKLLDTDGRPWRKVLVVRMDDALTDEHPYGIPRCPDGCYRLMSVRTEYHVVRTADREPKWTSWKISQNLLKEHSWGVDSG
jgi:hypothetical protein